MDSEAPIYRLQSLQRDLVAFSESRLPNVDRLSAELDASVEDLRRLLEKKRKNEASRKELLRTSTPPSESLRLGQIDYQINDDFRQSAVKVAEWLDLDELEAVKLCIDVSLVETTGPDLTLPLRAILRFQHQRQTLLECLRILLEQHNEAFDSDDSDVQVMFQAVVDAIMKQSDGRQDSGAALWRRCIDGLTDIETSLKKVGDHKQTMIMTGQAMEGEESEALEAQRLLLTRQHESLVGVMTNLLNGRFDFDEQPYRALISKAAALDSSTDIAIHYLPVLMASAGHLNDNQYTAPETSHRLHRLFEAGPAQQQWKMLDLKAVAIVTWLAEYGRRFEEPTADPQIRVADRQKAERDRADLFMQAVKDKALHFLLAACRWLKPEVWHDPAKLGLVGFLLSDGQAVPLDAPTPSVEFATCTSSELRSFASALVSSMPDVVRRLKNEEDDQRRLKFSMPSNETSNYEPDLERLIVITSYAYQDDADAAEDFWSDKESNLYGFLRWVSQRLPTPRVAAFCELLRSLASDAKSANQAHRFLLEDTTMMSGRLRKTYSVSWAQIFAELDTFASSLRDRPAVPQATQNGMTVGGEYIEGVETGIMLEAYLRLASHICRTSPDARNWLLREQSFHLGDVMFQLASSSIEGRLQASCFNMLSAMLTEKVTEVNDGMWVMLDNWVTAGGPVGSNVGRPAGPSRASTSERLYLQRFNDRPETASAFVALLNALIAPSPTHTEPTLDSLPFPENLGAPSRHAGIDAYVDFAIGTVFRHSGNHIGAGADMTEVDVLRYTCLDLIFLALATFNEDLVLLANTTNIAVDSAMRASSLATYARLHPFARVMEWLFNNNVIMALFAMAQHDVEALNELDAGAPRVQATLKSVQVMNLAMRLQATYFDIVRPLIKTHSTSRSPTVANAALASFDDVMLSQLAVVVDIASFITSNHADLSLEALSLLQKLAASRKLSEAAEPGLARSWVGNRLIGALANSSDAITLDLIPTFQINVLDVETGEAPLKVVKVQAILDLLNSSLNASSSRPTIAHCLLGFTCGERKVEVQNGSAFSGGASLFHAIAACCVHAPVAVPPTYLSWLLSVKRGCLEVIIKLALSPMTAHLVYPELLSMEFLDAVSKSQLPANCGLLWDSRQGAEPDALLSTSSTAFRDFMKVRELYFEYAALQLRMAAEQRAFSVQEGTMSALLGVIQLSTGEQEPTMSIFDLFDFLELETALALDVSPKYLANLDLSACLRDDPEIGTAYNLKMVEELLILRRRERVHNGTIKDANEEQQLDDEIRAILASLLSQNNYRSIQTARIATLEAWTELLSLMLTAGGLEQAELTALALHGLQVILPHFERSLSESLESAALLAKLTLSLVPPATLSLGQPVQQNANTAHERLTAAFRVCLKAITDGSTSLALRDVCYRVCLAVIHSMPLKVLNGKPAPSSHTKQLLQLVHFTGERLLTVITEDAFSGRGSTRVSAVLFLDSLVALFQAARVNAAMLKALSKLNFIPVMIDTSIGSVATSFQGQNAELVTTLAYFHTALALLLRICQTADGTQIVLNSGFFSAISDSRLFSTDPDIGLDIDNPVALKEFYKLLSSILRVIVAVVVSRGPDNAATLEQAKAFLQQNRFSMQAVFKRTSAVQKTSGPPEREALSVAGEFSKLLLVTGFLEDDEPAYQRATKLNGFT